MMNMTVRSKVVKIGNSRGIRIPRTILEQAGLIDEVEMRVEGNKLIIHACSHSRQGWAEHFETMAIQGDDRLLEEISGTRWDEDEWTW
ncbi:MAG: AbrB/MazE/SpoVT family DNA-binding domain-containing protein [Flexilinea sp.]